MSAATPAPSKPPRRARWQGALRRIADFFPWTLLGLLGIAVAILALGASYQLVDLILLVVGWVTVGLVSLATVVVLVGALVIGLRLRRARRGREGERWLEMETGRPQPSGFELPGYGWVPLLQSEWSVETPDDMTVVLNFEAPFPGVFDLLELMYIADVEASGDFSQTGIGTGPFALASHASGTATNLQRNADYWDGAPTLDGIEIMTVPNQQATLLALRSGDIDMVTELGYIDLVPFTRDGSFVTGDAPSGVAHDITINSRSAPLDNVAVREAIDLAIDRDRIARLLFGEFGQTLCLPFTEESLAYVAAQDDCRYDLDEAKTVLEGAGVDLPLSLRMLTSTEVRTEYTTIAEIMQADLAKIGINLEIENVDAVTYRRRYVQEQDFDLASHAYGRAGKDPSSLLETTVVFKPEGNVSGFSDASYAEAVTQGGSTPDNDARRAAYAGASEFLRDSHHVLSLVSRPRLWVTSEDIEGVSFSADGFAIFQNATKAD